MWGAIMPTKPIGPHTATTPPTMREVAKNSTFLILPTFAPLLMAISSPVSSRFNSCVSTRMMAAPLATNGAMFRTASNPATSSPPISQRRIRKELAKSLMYCANRMALEKKKLRATPARSMVPMEKPLRIRVSP